MKLINEDRTHVGEIKLNVIHIPCNRLIIQYLVQQIAQSIINEHLSVMFLLHVSTSTRSSSGRYIQRHTSTVDFVKDVRV
jgi:hypothetical protein